MEFLLLTACGYDIELANKYKARQEKGEIKLLAVYPGDGEEEPEGAEYIGEINDGGLYLVKVGDE